MLTSSATGSTHAPRERGVDLARGLAVVSMFVAHTAPSAGPGGLLNLSELLTFPLFALLVGAGSELAARRLAVLPHGAASLVRAAALLLLGWSLAQAGAHIVIVLAPLGVLTLLCWGVSRLPTTAVAAVGAAAGLLAPWTIEASRARWAEVAVAGETGALWWLDLLVSTSYPQAVLLLCGCVGIVLTRFLLPRSGGPAPVERPAAVLALALLVAGALAAARVAGVLELHAYETTWPEELFVTALATTAYAGCLLVARARAARLLAPLAWVGAMTLTLYALQIGWLAWWARGLLPGTSDDAWVNVVGMTVASLVLASLWRLAGLARPWNRGPVEGVVATAVDLALHASPGGTAVGPGGEDGRTRPGPVSSPRVGVREGADRG